LSELTFPDRGDTDQITFVFEISGEQVMITDVLRNENKAKDIMAE